MTDDIELRRQIEASLREYQEAKNKGDEVQSKITNSIRDNGKIYYLSDEEVALVKDAESKWDAFYDLVLKAHPLEG